jgi:hypothetical protein
MNKRTKYPPGVVYHSEKTGQSLTAEDVAHLKAMVKTMRQHDVAHEFNVPYNTVNQFSCNARSLSREVRAIPPAPSAEVSE